MKYFLFFLALAGFVGSASADEPPNFQGEIDRPPIDIWNEFPTILDGTIIQKTQSDKVTNYDIKINQLFKGTIKASLVSGVIPSDLDHMLNQGDRALIYLDKKNTISTYSVKTRNGCEPRDYIQISPVLPNDDSFVRGVPILPWDWKDSCVSDYFTYDPDFWNYMEYKSPLRQYADHHLPIHMQRCGNDEHISIMSKSHPHHISCVKESSVIELMTRGWAKISEFEVTSGFFDHTIKNGKIISVQYVNRDCSPSIKITLDTEEQGNLLVSIPRVFFNSDLKDDDFDLFIIVDGKEVDFEEIKDEKYRNLEISFLKDAKTIELIRTCLI